MRKQARPTGEDIMTNRIMPIVVWGLCFLPSRALFPLLEMASLLPEPSGTSGTCSWTDLTWGGCYSRLDC